MLFTPSSHEWLNASSASSWFSLPSITLPHFYSPAKFSLHHHLSLSFLIFQYYCLLQFSGHYQLSLPPTQQSLIILTPDVSCHIYVTTCVPYSSQKMYAHMNVRDCICQFCRLKVNLQYISMASCSAVYEAEGHEVLVQQLQRSCPKTVANVAATLCNMAQREVIRQSILSYGVIQALVEPLKSTDTKVLVNTTLCLAALACDEEDRAEVCVFLII